MTTPAIARCRASLRPGLLTGLVLGLAAVVAAPRTTAPWTAVPWTAAHTRAMPMALAWLMRRLLPRGGIVPCPWPWLYWLG